MKKSLIALSILLNIAFAFFVVKRLLFQRELAAKEKPQGPIIRYWLNRQNYLAMLPIKETDIVFIGDSHTQQFELAEMFGNINIKNRGINGDTSQGLFDRLQPVIDGKPKKIFIQIGTNDLTQNIPADTTAKYLTEIVKRCKSVSEVYVHTLFPTSKTVNNTDEEVSEDGLNSQIKTLCKAEGVTLIDVYASFNDGGRLKKEYDCGDHLHLSGVGYMKWKEMLTPYL